MDDPLRCRQYRTVVAAPPCVISPASVLGGAITTNKLPVNLTREQIEKSPGIETDEPVSAQQQRDLHAYNRWPEYWTIGPFPRAGVMPPAAPLPRSTGRDTRNSGEAGEPHLRSTDHVTDCRIHDALDGMIGQVDDFLVDVEEWMIRLIVVDARDWLPGKMVVVLPGAVDRISWTDSEVAVHLTREAIKESRQYIADQALDEGYEQRLSAYYEHLTVDH